MPVTNEHVQYTEFKEDWETIRDCVKGNGAIKKQKEKYLPMLSGQSPKDYERYIKKVKFFGATGRTLDGLHGNIFRKAPEENEEVSDTFRESLKNVDLMGTSIEQFASDVIHDCLQTNWGGILVDYVRDVEATSKADAEAKGIKWYLKYYPAESVINWEYETIGGKTQLSLVVLAETYTVKDPTDKFSAQKYKKWRVLYLDSVTKKYRQEVYDERISLKESAESEIVVKMNGDELDEILFYPLPANNPEKSILYDLAMLNIQHYVDTADYNNGKHYTSIPTPIAIGLSPELDEMGNPVPMYTGGTQFQFFPNENHTPGTDVRYLEFTGQGMSALADGINHLESQMAILGAHIIANEKRGVESPEALRIHRIGENGVLATFTRNISDSITRALRKKGEGDGEDVNKLANWSINFNTDYDLSKDDGKSLATLLSGRISGEIPRMSLYLGLKQISLIPEQWDFDDFIAELERDSHASLKALEGKQSETNDIDLNDIDGIEEDDD